MIYLSNICIVHLDIKPNNLLYSLKDMSPLLIDFGISIPMKSLDEKNKWEYFYAYIPEYYIWPLEVHVINYYITHNTRQS